MSTRTDGEGYDLDAALVRLAAEAASRPALEARVLADAAMVSAGRRPAPARPAPRAGGPLAAVARLLSRPALGLAGAAATVAVSLALVFGYGLRGDDAVPPGGLDDAVLSQLSPLDSLEREVVASLDAAFLDPDAPL